MTLGLLGRALPLVEDHVVAIVAVLAIAIAATLVATWRNARWLELGPTTV